LSAPRPRPRCTLTRIRMQRSPDCAATPLQSRGIRDGHRVD